ncbi:MAG: sugar phosphate permease, partial [Paraglaciecola psychrophila]
NNTMNNITNEKHNNSALFYGWKVVFTLLLINTMVSGLSFYNHAIIINALSRLPQFTVQSVSLAVSLFFLSGGITGLWVAKLLRDYDPRWCICAGAVVAALALSALGLVQDLWQLYILYCLFGMGFCASGLVPATTLVTRWFHRRRALALSVSSTGLSLGGVLITPLCAVLVESKGLLFAGPMMGLLYLFGVVPAALLWLRPSPESMGLAPDGDSPGAASAVTATAVTALSGAGEEPDSEYSAVIKGRLFWAISVAYIFLMLAQVGGIAHQFGIARELLSETQTVLAVAILPVASILGRLVGGWLIDQLSIRLFALAMMLLQSLSLGLLSLGSGIGTLYLGLALFGITVGNLLMLQPLLIAQAFGVSAYPRLFALSNLLSSLGTAAGPALLGVVYGFSGQHYGAAYAVAAAAGLIGMALFWAGGEIGRVRPK